MKLLEYYYPTHFFAVFRAHELYNVEPFIGLLNPPILDLGCGDGMISRILFGETIDYGVDPSEVAIKKALETGAYRAAFRCGAHHIPLGDESIGGIFSNCVLEHIPDLPLALKEVYRLLKPGGYFVATCLSPFYYSLNPVFKKLDHPITRPLLNRMVKKENALHHHVSVFGEEEYRKLFASNGMTLRSHKYYAPPSVMNFCNKWDTLSKYIMPFPVFLRHGGILPIYLWIRYGLLTGRKDTIRRWYNMYFDLCYDRNGSNTPGAGQILVAQKT